MLACAVTVCRGVGVLPCPAGRLRLPCVLGLPRPAPTSLLFSDVINFAHNWEVSASTFVLFSFNY